MNADRAKACTIVGMLSHPLYLIHVPSDRSASWPVDTGFLQRSTHIAVLPGVGAGAALISASIGRRLARDWPFRARGHRSAWLINTRAAPGIAAGRAVGLRSLFTGRGDRATAPFGRRNPVDPFIRIPGMEGVPLPHDGPADAAAPARGRAVSFALLDRLRARKPMTSPQGLDRLDALMLAVARDCDKAALEALFVHFGPLIKSWLMRSGSSASAADDLVQDTFVAVWHKAHQFDPGRARVAAWLFTITRNLRVDRLRRPGESWSTLDDAGVDGIASPDGLAEDALSARQREGRVRWALSQLTADQRNLLQLNFYEDKSHSDIAAELALPLGTVKTRLRRAAARLRELLDDHRP